MPIRPIESRWRRVGVGTVVLLVSTLLPLPFDRRPEWGRFGPDKLLHFVGHAGYTLVLADAWVTEGRDEEDATLLAVVVSVGLGLLIGRLQEWVPGRANESSDLIAGVLGSVVAAIGWHVRPRRERR